MMVVKFYFSSFQFEYNYYTNYCTYNLTTDYMTFIYIKGKLCHYFLFPQLRHWCKYLLNKVSWCMHVCIYVHQVSVS